MVKAGARSFGQLIRERRRELHLTLQEVARRSKTSTGYIARLEAGKRHPSEIVLTKLADVLGLECRELFFGANPSTQALLSQPAQAIAASAWDQFRRDRLLLQAHNVSPQEMEMLSHVALMGEVRSSRDFIYILNAIRQALAR